MNAIIDRALDLMRGIAGLRATITLIDTGVATIELRWADSMSVHDQIRGAESARRAIRKAGICCHILCVSRDTDGSYSRLRLIAPRRGSRVSHAERYAITATQEQLDLQANRRRCVAATGARAEQDICQMYLGKEHRALHHNGAQTTKPLPGTRASRRRAQGVL